MRSEGHGDGDDDGGGDEKLVQKKRQQYPKGWLSLENSESTIGHFSTERRR